MRNESYVILDVEQVHTFRQLLQILLALPYVHREVEERVSVLVQQMDHLLGNTYNTTTIGN